MPGSISILLVDDEKSILEITKIFLEREGGINVDTVISAEEGFSRLESGDYDVIISDYDMPGMDGIFFLKELRARGDNTPFIMFTGRGRESVAIEALNSGATFYLQKGGDPMSQFADLRNAIIQTAQRKFAEEEVLKARDFLNNIINSIADPVFVKDHEHRWILLNDAYCELMGNPRDQLLNRTDHDFFPKDKADIFWRKDDIVFGTGEENIYEEVFTDSSGRNHYNIIKENLYTDITGNKYLVGVISDITGQKRTEMALRESEEEMCALFNAITDVIIVVDSEGRYLKIAPNVPGLLYRPSEELVGKSLYDVFSREQAEFFHDHIKEALNTDKPVKMEYSLKIDDREVWFDGTLSPMTTDTVVLVARDITGIKKAEKDLRIKDQAIHSAMIGIVFTDVKSRIIYANPAALEMAGYDSEDEVIGKSAYGFIEDKREGRNALQTLISTGKWQGEVRLVRKDDTAIYMLGSAGVVRDDEGRPMCNMISFLDISKEKEAELALIKRKEELERFERMVAGKEIRMMELRDRIHELEEEQDKKQGCE